MGGMNSDRARLYSASGAEAGSDITVLVPPGALKAEISMVSVSYQHCLRRFRSDIVPLKKQNDASAHTVATSRVEVADIIHTRDRRLLVIIGPCSIHDPIAASSTSSTSILHPSKDTIRLLSTKVAVCSVCRVLSF
jgi:hypothetical protein